MQSINHRDVIIVGGSYAGLAASMALGRALRNVLVIDSNLPCNRQTPNSHNFLTQDGTPPGEIARIGKEQVSKYKTVEFLEDRVIQGTKRGNNFEIQTQKGKIFIAKKIIFATGIKDIMPEIPGFTESWGISVLHCPYCHGYEVRELKTGIFANGETAFELTKLISNWTKEIIIFTNGKQNFNQEHLKVLRSLNISIEERKIKSIEHSQGKIESIKLLDDSKITLQALYTRLPFNQHSSVPQELGCTLTKEGYLKVDEMQQTNIHGVFACGDNAGKIRTVANAVATGAYCGMMVNKELIEDKFH